MPSFLCTASPISSFLCRLGTDMNSIFNQGSAFLRSLTRDELLRWIETEGLSVMPPIIQVLVEHLRKTAELETENEELDQRIVDRDNAWEKARENGVDTANDCIRGLKKKLDGMLEELDGAYQVLLKNGQCIDIEDVDEESPWDKLIFRRSDFNNFRDDCDELKDALEYFEAAEHFNEPSE